VYLQTHSITRSEYLSNLAQSRPPSVSPNSLNHGLQVHLQTRSITASMCISRLAGFWPASSHDHLLQVHLQTRSITAWKFATSWPPSAYLQSRSFTASKCISKYTRLWPPSASPKLLHHGLGVYLCVHSIIIFRRTLNCSESPPAASPDILCVDG